MLIEYINKAMSKAVYDKLDDGSFSGKIPQCPGVIAFGETLYRCEYGIPVGFTRTMRFGKTDVLSASLS